MGKDELCVLQQQVPVSPKMHLGILEQKESTSQLDYASQG